ncbi:hypothetical protein EV426DRAFT_38994 [Tirmania nivea]|nr:hypothetical protein EV426DRAFT_38994 [Tirmania nivea]
MPEAVDEQPANAETDEEVVEGKTPVMKKKAAPKRKGGRKPAKARGKKAAKPVEVDSDQETEQAIEGQPDEQSLEQPEENPEEGTEKGTGSSQAEIGTMAAECSELNNVSMPMAPEIITTTEESPVASLPANDDSQHDVDEDNALPPTLSQTPIPAPVIFSPSHTTQSFSEPTKSAAPVPSSPLARFSSPAMRSPIVGSRKRDFGGDVTPRSSPVKRSRLSPSTPLASSSRTTSFAVELATPSQLNRESTYTPQATFKHLDVASSPVLQPPRNVDESERPGKSPVKNATPRSSLDPAAARNLFGSIESNRWAGDSPSRRSSGVSPMKRQNMSFTEFGEIKPQAEDGGSGNDDDAGAQTEEDSEFQQDEDKDTLGQLTPSKDQEAEMNSGFEVETGVTVKETQDDTEVCTLATPVAAGDDSELEDNGAVHQQEDSHTEDDQEAAFVGDSTFNNDSLFAIPAEDFPVEGTAESKTANAEGAPEKVVESVADTADKNAADQLNEPSIGKSPH